MKIVATLTMVVALATGGAVACNAKTKAKVAKNKAPKLAVCPVCSINEGHKKPEPIAATLKYKGRTVYFCNQKDKAEFISNPRKYVASVK